MDSSSKKSSLSNFLETARKSAEFVDYLKSKLKDCLNGIFSSVAPDISDYSEDHSKKVDSNIEFENNLTDRDKEELKECKYYADNFYGSFFRLANEIVKYAVNEKGRKLNEVLHEDSPNAKLTKIIANPSVNVGRLYSNAVNVNNAEVEFHYKNPGGIDPEFSIVVCPLQKRARYFNEIYTALDVKV